MIGHVPMHHDRFNGPRIVNKTFLSDNARGKHSSVVSAHWSFNGQLMSTDHLHFGKSTIFFPTLCRFEL